MKRNTILAATIASLMNAAETHQSSSSPVNPAASLPPGALAKRGSKRDKAAGKGVTKVEDLSKWEAIGERDAKIVLAIDGSADMERCKLFARIGSEFGPLGVMPLKDGQKKAKFHEKTEAYFEGWRKYRESDAVPPTLRPSVTVRMAEARRVVHNYIVKGTDHMNGLMKGPGTYHQKINALDTMTAKRAPKEPAAPKEPGNVNLAEVKEASQRVAIIAKYTEREIGEIVSNIPESQLHALVNATALRCLTSKDKDIKEIGERLKLLTESAKRAESGHGQGVKKD